MPGSFLSGENERTLIFTFMGIRLLEIEQACWQKDKRGESEQK